MTWKTDIQTLIRKRSSVRAYLKQPLSAGDYHFLNDALNQNPSGPWKAVCRFKLIASQPGDMELLKNLGTYGFIQNPAGFIIGVTENTEESLLQFGYQMEYMILRMTDRDIGSCWLGGSLQKSRFIERIEARTHEILPAAVSLGYPKPARGIVDRLIRYNAGSDKRKSRESLFFLGDFNTSLSPIEDEMMNIPLEMTRLAPSASNRQPWRIVKEIGRNIYHFFIQRNPGYQHLLKLGNIPDLQMVDMGIAICHFHVTVMKYKIHGDWHILSPEIDCPNDTDYVISWSDQ